MLCSGMFQNNHNLGVFQFIWGSNESKYSSRNKTLLTHKLTFTTYGTDHPVSTSLSRNKSS